MQESAEQRPVTRATPERQTPPAAPPDLDTVKARMKAVWESGDYAHFARYMEPGARQILADWGIVPGRVAAGARLLDVGCGAGQTAIPAAQAGMRVAAIDIAANLVQAGRQRAAQAGVAVDFREGDAEAIPYPAATFDCVISLIGAMFAPRPERVVAELARVSRPGARLCMANWTPASLPAQMFNLAAQWVPLPPGVQPPVLWGDEDTVHERLAADFTGIRLVRRHYPRWAYPFSTAQLADFFCSYFGPVHRAHASLDEDGRRHFREALIDTFDAHSQVTADGLELRGEYLDVQALRR